MERQIFRMSAETLFHARICSNEIIFGKKINDEGREKNDAKETNPENKKTKYTIFTLARQNVRKVLFAELDSLSKWVRDRR